MKSQKEFKTIVEYKEYLRFYFSGIAMQGILSNPNGSQKQDGTNHTYLTLAETAVNCADGLLNILDK